MLPKLTAALQPRQEAGGECGSGNIDDAAQAHDGENLGERGEGGLRDAVVLAASHFTGEEVDPGLTWISCPNKQVSRKDKQFG